MKEISFNELAAEIKARAGYDIPLSFYRTIIRMTFTKVFKILHKTDQYIRFPGMAVTRIVEIHDGSKYVRETQDIDETKMPDPELMDALKEAPKFKTNYLFINDKIDKKVFPRRGRALVKNLVHRGFYKPREIE